MLDRPPPAHYVPSQLMIKVELDAVDTSKLTVWCPKTSRQTFVGNCLADCPFFEGMLNLTNPRVDPEEMAKSTEPLLDRVLRLACKHPIARRMTELV